MNALRPRVARLSALSMALAFCGLAPLSFADWVRDFKLDGLFNDNVSRANRDADVRDDFALAASARLGRFDQLTDDLRLTVSADFEGQLWEQYGDFDQLSAGGTAALRYRFGLGAMAPFARIEGGVRYANFRQNLQDGIRWRAAVTAGKRLTEKLELQAAYFFDEADASERTFDQRGHSFSVRAAFDVTRSTQLTAGYTLRGGEVISYAVKPRPDLVALANAEIEVDTFGFPFMAYNLDATSHTFSVGATQAFTSMLGGRLRYEHQITSRDHITYKNNVVIAGLAISF